MDKEKDEIEQEKKRKNGQTKNENTILKKLFIGIGGFIVVLILIVIVLNSTKNFEYKGLKFNIEKMGNLIFYRTSIPIYTQTNESKELIADYNFYLRNDPRKLDAVPYEGNIELLRLVVINSTNELNCNGDGVIAIKNLADLYTVIGAKVIKDENASCDSQGRYMFLDIKPGETTNIEQTGPACHKIEINNCEILKGAEKFMIETFLKIRETGFEVIIDN